MTANDDHLDQLRAVVEFGIITGVLDPELGKWLLTLCVYEDEEQ